MLILAFDTATPAVTVAVHDGTRVLAQESVVDARRHGELLSPGISKVLASAGATPADLTAVAVGTGPGPYTGLRVGLVTAQVLGAALGIRVDGICTLDVIAADARQAAVLAYTVLANTGSREFVVATDARRKEVYWARYTAEGKRLGDPQVTAPGLVPAGCPKAGEGPHLYPELAIGDELIEPRYPSAARLAELAARNIIEGVPAGPAEPLYLRRPDAAEPGRPKRVTP